MEYFSQQLTLLLPMAGFDLFRAPGHGMAESRDGAIGDEPVFVFATAGASATGREVEDGFLVTAGSTARRTPTETFPDGYRALRDQLLADGTLINGLTSDLYTFAGDYTFSSPSAAASIVAARSAAGPREWREERTGQSYGDWRAAGLEDA